MSAKAEKKIDNSTMNQLLEIFIKDLRKQIKDMVKEETNGEYDVYCFGDTCVRQIRDKMHMLMLLVSNLKKLIKMNESDEPDGDEESDIFEENKFIKIKKVLKYTQYYCGAYPEYISNYFFK